MPSSDWEHVFTSLNFMQRATISKAKIRSSNLPPPAGAQLRARALDNQKISIPLSDNEDSWSFDVGTLSTPITQLILEDLEGEELLRIDGLMPRNDEEYEHGFRSASRRSEDPYLNFFIAHQMALHFPGTVAYRISAVVVAMYKAIEIRDPEYLKCADTLYRLAEDLLPHSSVARSPRRNKEHLQISLWCAEWHLRLIHEDFAGFIETLEKIRSYMETETLANYFNVAYPANKSLSLLCLYHFAAGRRTEARDVMRLAFSLFQRSVRDADTTTAHFQELGSVHKATYECLTIAKSKKGISANRSRRIFRGATRIRPEDHSDSFQVMLKTFEQGLGV